MQYELIRKNVKNINLKIKSDLTIVVTAPKGVSVRIIDDFVNKKKEWIQKKCQQYQSKILLTETEDIYVTDSFHNALSKILPLFDPYMIPTPIMRIRVMKTRWGSCSFKKGIITINKLLAQTSEECIEYVIAHELVHFIHPDHSKKFYTVMEQIMPSYQDRQKQLDRYRLK